MNKKILTAVAATLLAGLVAATLVACETDEPTVTDAPTEDVTTPTTDAPTETPTDDATDVPTEEVTTEEVTTEEVTTEEVTTEEVTTEEVTTEPDNSYTVDLA